jgi:Asparaginase, N-terminal
MVAVLSTRGTIASRQDSAKGGYLPALAADDLIGAIPAIRTVAQVQTYQISNISSSDMTPKIWLELSTRINEMLAQPAIASVVVTHGTNTLAAPEAFCDRRHNQRGAQGMLPRARRETLIPMSGTMDCEHHIFVGYAHGDVWTPSVNFVGAGHDCFHERAKGSHDRNF